MMHDLIWQMTQTLVLLDSSHSVGISTGLSKKYDLRKTESAVEVPANTTACNYERDSELRSVVR